MESEDDEQGTGMSGQDDASDQEAGGGEDEEEDDDTGAGLTQAERREANIKALLSDRYTVYRWTQVVHSVWHGRNGAWQLTIPSIYRTGLFHAITR